MYPAEFTQVCEQLLNDGLLRFQLSLGIVSHIQADNYQIVSITALDETFKQGANFDLNDTYCREVITSGKTIALTQIDGQIGLAKHPLYQSIPLEAYISAPIFLFNSIWGTLNFSSGQLRKVEFNADDIEWIESAAREVTNKLLALNLI